MSERKTLGDADRLRLLAEWFHPEGGRPSKTVSAELGYAPAFSKNCATDLRRIAARLEAMNTCVVCGATLEPSTEHPHCIDCVVIEEELEP